MCERHAVTMHDPSAQRALDAKNVLSPSLFLSLSHTRILCLSLCLTHSLCMQRIDEVNGEVRSLSITHTLSHT